MRDVDVVTAGPRRVLGLALLTCALLALLPAAATANSDITVTPALQTNVSVGDANVPGTLTITNANSGADTSSTICEPGDPAPCPADTPGITLLPSCSSMDFAQNCLLAGANPGVFSIDSPASGAAGSACAGKSFSVAVVDATFGKVRFVPTGGHVVLPTPGSSCQIRFTFDVLKLPADGHADTGYQTLQRAEALAYSNLNSLVYDPGTQPPVNVTLASPTLSDIDPDSPSSDNSPKVKGSAPVGTTQVRLYTNATCTGSPIAQGSATTFASPGLTAPVGPDTTTSFYAVAVDNLGGVSDCSTSTITYVEDSTPPGVPGVSDSDPDSPANDNAPHIKGTAAAGSTVRLYTTSDCSGPAAAQGSAAAFASPGLAVAVADNTTTAFYASATDATGNVSGCSPSFVTYTEDSAGPQVPIVSGPTGPTTSSTPTITFSSPEAGTTFECRIDTGPFVPCTSPFTPGALAPGQHTFEVRSKDAAGNVGATTTLTFTVAGVTPPPPPPPVTPTQTGCVGIAGRVFVGTAGRNVRTGDAKTDIMFGLGGNDALRGGGGLDCLYGGASNDALRGESGNDRLFGGTGNDLIDGGAGNDRLSGESGSDRILGGAGNDQSSGGAGRDSILDRRGKDRLSGGAGNDRIDARDSTRSGRRGVDRILCGSGVDTVLADSRDNVARDCERSHLTRRSL